MWDLFNIAIDSEVPLEDRYAALRIMASMQRVKPRDYRKLQMKAVKQRKYNDNREYIKHA